MNVSGRMTSKNSDYDLFTWSKPADAHLLCKCTNPDQHLLLHSLEIKTTHGHMITM